jgi:hypothetical protein
LGKVAGGKEKRGWEWGEEWLEEEEEDDGE